MISLLNRFFIALKERRFLKSGDVVINTGSTPVDLHLQTNVLKISTVD